MFKVNVSISTCHVATHLNISNDFHIFNCVRWAAIPVFAGPQIISGLLGGSIIAYLFDGNAVMMLMIAGVAMLLGAASVNFVKEAVR